ncbi:MAG: winged helix DNA-binding domain-containing protein, partial [Acidobacteria bacterium]|nr:winged helix DNA-binding domain-containing protein [Acidobacteriota bacterium]
MSASVIAQRLAAQRLARPSRQSAAGVVAWFGAVQAQEYGPSRWGIGQRAKALTDADVARAFDAGDILRTHIMRPTWHFVAPQDIRWMQALTGPRVRAASGSVLRVNELDARLLARSRAVIARALEG